MKSIIAGFIFILLTFPTAACAADKVVVVPLSSSAAAGKNIVGGGFITSTGNLTKSWGIGFTVTRTGTGAYKITFPGMNPGCSSPFSPYYLITLDRKGFGTQSTSSSCNVSSGDYTRYVHTYDIDGHYANSNFTLLILDGGAT